MLERHLLSPFSETRFSSRNRWHAVSARRAPRQNYLLAALPRQDYELLLRYTQALIAQVGQIAVLDRPRLEARVCECYAVIRRTYDRLVPGYRRG